MIIAKVQTSQSLKSAAPALAAALKDGEESVRVSAAGALARIGPAAAPAVPALIAAIEASWPKGWERGPSGRLRAPRRDETFQRAIEALGAIGPPAKAAIPVLSEALESSNSPWPPGEGPAATALEKIRGPVRLEDRKAWEGFSEKPADSRQK